MKNKTVIIGGGVAGLISAFYNPESIVLDKNPLGQLNMQFIPGPRIFKANNYTENFLKKLKIDFHKETIKVGYTTDGFTLVTNNQTFKEKYALITRGTSKIEKSFLSSGEENIEIFTNGKHDFYGAVFNKLYETVKSQIKSVSVKEIDVENKVIKTSEENFEYDTCISTINIKILCGILGIEEINPQSSLKHFVCCEYVNDKDKELSKAHHYIYSINNLYSRKTYFDKYIVYETVFPYKDDIKHIDGNKIIHKVNNLPIQVVNSIDIKNLKGIELLGRFAQWNHNIKANEIIELYESAI